MKKRFSLLSFLALVMVLLSSCETTEPPTPAENLTGKWIIQSSELLGAVIPGDGSYLRFNACTDTQCTGEDFEATDGTSGTFTYDLSDDATTITIVDTTNDGGNYDATWDILELTETDFRIEGNTLFGSFKVEMTKE